MNWDVIAGNWKQLAGHCRQQWGKLTDDDLAVIRGQREELCGRLQERYGIRREQAEAEVDEWQRKLKEGG